MKTHAVLAVFVIVAMSAPLLYGQEAWQIYPDSPVFSNSTGTDWDRGTVAAPMIVMLKDTLRMWYEGGINGYNSILNIGYAWSLDGITWTRNTDGPVLSARSGEWDHPNVGTPSVLVDGDTLRMWYGGGRFTSSGLQIGYAWSLDGIDWHRNPNPVVLPTSSWSNDGILPGGVLKEDGIFKMWFNGGIGPVANPTSNSRWSVGFATSPDGINWTPAAEPVLRQGSGNDFDRENVLPGSVLRTDDGYEMWYSGSYREAGGTRSSIGYATSSDGTNWVKYPSNPVLRQDFTMALGIGHAFYSPRVVVTGNKYNMWFAAWYPGPTIAYASFDIETGIDGPASTSIPEAITLYKNYPDPLNGATTIKYEVATSGHVSLIVHDLMGRNVAVLADGYRYPGTHQVQFDGSWLSSGIYFVRLSANGRTKSMRMTVVR